MFIHLSIYLSHLATHLLAPRMSPTSLKDVTRHTSHVTRHIVFRYRPVDLDPNRGYEIRVSVPATVSCLATSHLLVVLFFCFLFSNKHFFLQIIHRILSTSFYG